MTRATPYFLSLSILLLGFVSAACAPPRGGSSGSGDDDDAADDDDDAAGPDWTFTPVTFSEMRVELRFGDDLFCAIRHVGSDRDDLTPPDNEVDGAIAYFAVDYSIDPSSSCFTDTDLSYDDWVDENGQMGLRAWALVPSSATDATLWLVGNDGASPWVSGSVLGSEFSGEDFIESSDGLDAFLVTEVRW